MFRLIRLTTVEGVRLVVDNSGLYEYETRKKIPLYPNPKRSNRVVYRIENTSYYVARTVAKAYPEICGIWFEGCEVHHIDRNPLNNVPSNLLVIDVHNHRLLHSSENAARAKEKCSIPVHQYSMDGEYIQTFPSSMDAARYIGKGMSAIRNNLCGISQSAFGYRWYQGEKVDKLPPIGTPRERCREASIESGTYKKVTNGIKAFDSIRDAAAYYGISHTAIGNCLKGRSKSSGGFKWSYLSV